MRLILFHSSITMGKVMNLYAFQLVYQFHLISVTSEMPVTLAMEHGG